MTIRKKHAKVDAGPSKLMVRQWPGEVNFEVLLSEVGQDNHEAFQQLYQHTSAHLFGVVLRILRNESIAEDALRETFVRIWNNAPGYQSELGKPTSWMTSIARYHALDLLRSQPSQTDRDTRYERENRGQEQSTNKPIDIEQGNSQLLSTCLQRISHEQQTCIIGAYCEGYTHHELSSNTGAPVATVKSCIRRALRNLRECLDELS